MEKFNVPVGGQVPPPQATSTAPSAMVDLSGSVRPVVTPGGSNGSMFADAFASNGEDDEASISELISGESSEPRPTNDTDELSASASAAMDALFNPSSNDTVPAAEPELPQEEVVGLSIVPVYRKRCLKCTALTEFGEKLWSSCHFSKGNTLCPAASIRITQALPLDRMAQQYVEAERNQNFTLVAQYAARMATFSETNRNVLTKRIAYFRENL